MSDVLKAYGEVCSNRDCEGCLIGLDRGELSCPEFLAKFPERATALINQMQKQDVTYYNEFRRRFPSCNISSEVLSDCACRRAIFEGYLDCQGDDCLACWNALYTGDIQYDAQTEYQNTGDDDDFDAQAVINLISQGSYGKD